MKKAVFFDIDGTLLNSSKGAHEMTSAVKNSIRELQKNDTLVFIASGRPYAFLNDDIKNFGFDGYILMNGSLILLNDKSDNDNSTTGLTSDSSHITPFYKDAFEKELLKELVKKFDEYKIEYILQDEKYSYLKPDFEHLKSLYKNIKISNNYIKYNLNIDDINVYKIELYCPDKESVDFCKTLEDDNFRYTHFDEFNLFELYSRKNTKASGILKVLEHFDIDIKNSFAFGDSHNDIEMLNTVGCGIVMGNASDEIKTHGDKITKSVSEDGVAYGIKNYILNQPAVV